MTTRPKRIEPAPGQESVWDYPRPPRFERTTKHIRIDLDGEEIANTTRAIRVLETSHPPVFYIPMEDVKSGILSPPTSKRSFCEWKGEAKYFDVGPKPNAAWSYDSGELKNHVAFYPSRMDACWVDNEKARPQPGDFYGGWITNDIVGPFKGGPGTMGW